MEKVFCNDLQPRTRIRITAKSGEVTEHKVIKMIPMQLFKGDVVHEISDIEILLDRKKNTYFSYERYLSGESWVQHIEIIKEKR